MATDDKHDPFTPTEKRRIDAERKALNLRPWEFSPTEVQDYECPYPDEQVRRQWAEAAALWRQMQAARRAKKKVERRDGRSTISLKE